MRDAASIFDSEVIVRSVRRHSTAWAMVALFALGGAFFGGMVGIYGLTNKNPCKTVWHQYTGVRIYDGHTFTCFHGEITGEQQTARMGQRGVSK